MDFVYYLGDQWFLSVWHNFSILLFMISGIMTGIVKLIAKVHPNVPTNTILELIRIVFTNPVKIKK